MLFELTQAGGEWRFNFFPKNNMCVCSLQCTVPYIQSVLYSVRWEVVCSMRHVRSLQCAVSTGSCYMRTFPTFLEAVWCTVQSSTVLCELLVSGMIFSWGSRCAKVRKEGRHYIAMCGGAAVHYTAQTCDLRRASYCISTLVFELENWIRVCQLSMSWTVF